MMLKPMLRASSKASADQDGARRLSVPLRPHFP
jgi:hypothetical protein